MVRAALHFFTKNHLTLEWGKSIKKVSDHTVIMISSLLATQPEIAMSYVRRLVCFLGGLFKKHPDPFASLPRNEHPFFNL